MIITGEFYNTTGEFYNIYYNREQVFVLKNSSNSILQLTISRHMVVCRVAKKRGECNGVSILTGRTKRQFLHICSSVMSDLNGTKFTMEVPKATFQI